MATFQQLQVLASSRLKDPNNTAVSAADVAYCINQAVTRHKDTRFWFNTFGVTVPLVINDPILPALPGGIIPLSLFKKDGIVINYAQARWQVTKVLSDEYDAENTQGKGLPYCYTYRNKQYELYYYPDQEYSAVVRGLKDYADMVNPSDTNDFTESASDLILYEALARLFAEYRQDPAMSDYYENRVLDERKDLLTTTRKLNASGSFEVQGF